MGELGSSLRNDWKLPNETKRASFEARFSTSYSSSSWQGGKSLCTLPKTWPFSPGEGGNCQRKPTGKMGSNGKAEEEMRVGGTFQSNFLSALLFQSICGSSFALAHTVSGTHCRNKDFGKI